MPREEALTYTRDIIFQMLRPMFSEEGISKAHYGNRLVLVVYKDATEADRLKFRVIDTKEDQCVEEGSAKSDADGRSSAKMWADEYLRSIGEGIPDPPEWLSGHEI